MSMYIGVSGLKAATTDLNTTSQNVANASTTGFKTGRAEFGDLVDQNAVMGGGMGVKTQAINQQFQQGAIITTPNALDLAITGNGFFQVKDPDGTFSYTRAGSFHIQAAPSTTPAAGSVVNNLGQILCSGGTAVVIGTGVGPYTNVKVDKDGKITADALGAAVTPTGSPLKLATFPNPQGLDQLSDTEWKQSTASGVAAFEAPGLKGTGNLMSGALEASNVDLTDQLVNMIMAQRNFQANSKTITTNQTLTETITNMIR